VLDRQGVQYAAVELQRGFDARYAAQMFEVTAAAPEGRIDDEAVALMAKAFEQRYAELYGPGSGMSEAGLQIITYRVRGVGRLTFQPTLPAQPPADSPDAGGAIKARRRVFLEVARGFEDTAIYDYRSLRPGHRLPGPAVIEVPTTTVTIPAGRVARVDELGNIRLILQVGE
jgi:N-methylhydantoinase A